MRYCRFDDRGQAVTAILRGNEYVLDLRRIDPDLPRDLHALANDPAASRELEKIVRGEPPVGSLRRVDNTVFLPPVQPGRVILRGGASSDYEPSHVAAPGQGLAATGSHDLAAPWTTGVACVLRHRSRSLTPANWQDHVLGFTAFHATPQGISLGPWIVGLDEVRDPVNLAFSSFVDDLPFIRPTKALLDWGAELAAADEIRTLRGGDVLCLAAPPADPWQIAELDPSSEPTVGVRSALVVSGAVMARLEATIDASPAATTEVPALNPEAHA